MAHLNKEFKVLEEFKGPRSVIAEDATISDGYRRVDGELVHEVKVNIAEQRGLVTLSVSDAVTVEAVMDPFLALAVAESLINAALAIYIGRGAPVRRGASS